MMKLKDWNESLKYAENIANHLHCQNNIDVRVAVFQTNDGKKGIAFQLFDYRGDFYTEYRTRCISDDAETMKYDLTLLEATIIREHC